MSAANQRSRKSDLIAALVLFGVGLFGLLKALRLPVGDLRAPDTAFMPVLLCGLLMALAALLFVTTLLWSRTVGAASTATRDPVFAPGGARKLVLLLVGLVGWFVLLEPLGFIIVTLAVVLLIGRLAGCGWVEALVIAGICSIGSYFLIVHYLKGPLPAGLLPF